MLEPDTRARPERDALFTELEDEEAVVLHLGTQTYYTLNRTGTHIWRCIENGLPVEAICVSLQKRFEVDDAHARQSVTTFLKRMAAEKLIRLAPRPREGS